MQDAGSETRASSIKILPALIREYESEYHYLFHLVLEFSRSPDGRTGYFYVMPNALRKVLEIFLAFKMPGSEGLSDKVENVAKDSTGSIRRVFVHLISWCSLNHMPITSTIWRRFPR